jgi:hypothetical protein
MHPVKQMPEDDSTTRTIEDEKVRIEASGVYQRAEDTKETKRIDREKKKPQPRKPAKKKRA